MSFDPDLRCPAVRAAYGVLMQQLFRNFEIAVPDAFDFVTRDEFEEPNSNPFRHAIHRVVAWELEGAATLNERCERERAER